MSIYPTIQVLQGLRVAVRLAVLREIQVAARRCSPSNRSRRGGGPPAAAVRACRLLPLCGRPLAEALQQPGGLRRKRCNDAVAAQQENCSRSAQQQTVWVITKFAAVCAPPCAGGCHRTRRSRSLALLPTPRPAARRSRWRTLRPPPAAWAPGCRLPPVWAQLRKSDTAVCLCGIHLGV